MQKSRFRDYEHIQKQNNLSVKNYIDAHYGPASLSRPAATTTYVIPVVFHVVHLSGDAYGTKPACFVRFSQTGALPA